MKRRGIFITSILFIFLLLIENMGFSADLKDYKPKSPDEEAIVSLLNKWKENWESGNVQGILDMLHDDAKIMLRGGPYPVKIATKEEAKVKIWVVLTEGTHMYYNWLYWFNLVKENNRWSIMGWKRRGQ
jgi:hypothetical protein